MYVIPELDVAREYVYVHLHSVDTACLSLHGRYAPFVHQYACYTVRGMLPVRRRLLDYQRQLDRMRAVQPIAMRVLSPLVLATATDIYAAASADMLPAPVVDMMH